MARSREKGIKNDLWEFCGDVEENPAQTHIKHRDYRITCESVRQEWLGSANVKTRERSSLEVGAKTCLRTCTKSQIGSHSGNRCGSEHEPLAIHMNFGRMSSTLSASQPSFRPSRISTNANMAARLDLFQYQNLASAHRFLRRPCKRENYDTPPSL